MTDSVYDCGVFAFKLIVCFAYRRSWIGEENGWVHQTVPKDVLAEADALAKAAIVEDSDDDD